MLTNDDFKLSDSQFAAYNAWSTQIATALGKAGAGESLEIVISFSFSALGRSVEAVVPTSGQKLVLEDALSF